MQILYVANVRMPTEKAHGLQIANMCAAFVRQGDEVTLLAARRRNEIKEDLFVYYGIKERFTIRRVFVLDAAFLGRIGFIIELLTFTVSAYIQTRRYVKTHSVYSRDILFAAIMNMTGYACVYEDHEPMRNKKLYRFLLARIPRRVVVAPGLQELYREMDVSGDICVAPNGVDVPAIDVVEPDPSVWERTFGIPRGMNVVLYLGHFYEWKGVYTLLDAVPLLPKDTAVVCIGGTSEDRAKVDVYIKKKNISRIHIHPFIPHRKVLTYLKSATVVVLPNTAKEERSLRYTTPLKLFEYLASGVPVVASRIPSVLYYVSHGKTAELFSPDDPNRLAEAIAHVLSDAEYAASLSVQARQSVVQWDISVRAQSIRSFMLKS